MLGDTQGMMQAKHRAAQSIAALPGDVATAGTFSISVAEDPPYTATSLLLIEDFERAAHATRRVLRSAYPGAARSRGQHSSNYARTLLILGLAEAGRGRADEAAGAGQAALTCARPVWPTMVLARQLDQVLTSRFDAATEVKDYHAHFRDVSRRGSIHTDRSRDLEVTRERR